MEIDINSWHSRWIRFVYNIDEYEMPQSLCSYFWLLLFSFILIPLILPFIVSYLVANKIIENTHILLKVVFSVIFCIVIWFMGILGVNLYSKIYDIPLNNIETSFSFILAYIGIGFAFCSVGIVIILGISFLMYKIISLFSTRLPGIFERKYVITEFFKSFNKYCPKINWKNHE